jgi:hypothetical protein
MIIACKKAFKKYLFLLEALGIPYTDNFSTVGFEFAQRVFIHGCEVTGAYTSALARNIGQPELWSLE